MADDGNETHTSITHKPYQSRLYASSFARLSVTMFTEAESEAVSFVAGCDCLAAARESALDVAPNKNAIHGKIAASFTGQSKKGDRRELSISVRRARLGALAGGTEARRLKSRHSR